MKRVTLFCLLFWVLLLGYRGHVDAQEDGTSHVVTAADGPGALAVAVAQAQDGDTIDVHGGVYAGPLEIDRAITLTGHDWPVIDGDGSGTVLKLTAPGTAVTGFVVRNSGDSLDEENAGIAVEASHITVANNRLQETLFGIYLRDAAGSVVAGNEIHSKDLPVPRRGDAIRVWYSNDVVIENNVVEKGRDVVLWYSERLTVRGNDVADGRYGLHFMYCDDAMIEDNRLLRNSVGAFLMYSRRLTLHNNTIAFNRGPSGYGVGLKDMDAAVVENNLFLDNRVGAYIDNSPREIDSFGRFHTNVFAYNDIGLRLLPSVRHNQFSNNSFMENQEQVAISGGGRLQENEWSNAGGGNYWSDYAGYDANGDGLGDVVYKSERLFENMMDRQSELRLFLYSPATNAIDFAAEAFPFVKPQPKLVDEKPLMAPAIPAGLPPLPDAANPGWRWVPWVLIVVAGGLVWLPRLRPRLAGKRAPTEATPAGDSPMIEIANLTKQFGPVTAVDHLSFRVQEGEAVALWGANGAGKTTALRCLLNLLPYDGEITVAGLDARRQGKAVRQRIGFVPQELTFHDDMTVRETLFFYAALKKVGDGFDFEPLLARLELSQHVDKLVRELSGGLKQRLALALALLSEPPILLMDEPTANLDVRAREDFLHLLLSLKRAGKTLLFSSHRLHEVMSLADRVLVLESGRLVVDCPPAELGQRLGWKTTLRLSMPVEGIESAMATLARHGLDASRNGHGVRVQVQPGEKGKPIQVLCEAGIAVTDFTVE